MNRTYNVFRRAVGILTIPAFIFHEMSHLTCLYIFRMYFYCTFSKLNILTGEWGLYLSIEYDYKNLWANLTAVIVGIAPLFTYIIILLYSIYRIHYGTILSVDSIIYLYPIVFWWAFLPSTADINVSETAIYRIILRLTGKL